MQYEPESLPLSSKIGAIDFNKVDSALKWLEQADNHYIIGLFDPLYPSLLQQIYDPPTVLFIKGNINALLPPSIAIVGSRNMSLHGANTTAKIAQDLSLKGFSITSGLAAGIDGAAHQAVVKCQGVTIAVLGCGIDVVYPKRHKQLYIDIQHDGCIVSELWPQVSPIASHFPKRNRIVSGLSIGTLVVEAARKSGSLITARLAMEQNREVFAVPGSIVGQYHQGCHDLIKNGVKLVEDAADIIEELSSLSQFHLDQLHQRHHIEQSEMSNLPFSPQLASLLKSVGYETTTIDAVVEHSGEPLDLVLVQLLELELQGWVAVVPGGYVRLKRS
ncbi:DNA-processing protein DprA [Shewanella gaetbuli]